MVRRVKLLRRDQTAISQGVGLVEMNSEEEALRAMDYLDGAQIDGKKLTQYFVDLDIAFVLDRDRD